MSTTTEAGRTKNPNSADIGSGLLTVAKFASQGVGRALGFSAVALAIGWQHWHSYLGAFGFSWLTSEIRPGDLLAAAALPVVTLAVCLIVSMEDATQAKDWERLSRRDTLHLLLAAIAGMILGTLFQWVGHYGAAGFCLYSSYLPIGLVASNLIVDLVYASTTGQRRQ